MTVSPILVTGAAGFIGSHVTERLLQRSDTVVGLDNFSDFYSPVRKRANVAELRRFPNFILSEIDIRDAARLQALFAEHRFQRVLHLAAVPGVRPSTERPAFYVDINIGGTTQVLEAARRHGTEHIVFASTSSVYGETQRIPFVETDAADRPLAPYPATKRAGELLGYTYHNLFGLTFTALRFFSVYGPRGRPDMMPYIVADGIVRGRAITLFDGGEMWRDWTYVDDIVSGVVAALDKPLGYEIVNLGRGEPVRMADFVARMEQLAGQAAIVNAAPAPKSESHRTYADVSKAGALLGYAPQHSIESGVAKFWEWFDRERVD